MASMLDVTVVVVLVSLGCLTCRSGGQLCKDIDPTACKLMSSSRPDLCQDPTLSKTACPKFCNLCPIECYSCNTTVQDYHECNTTELCGAGEVCMRKELTSFVDGHREYELSCEKKERCDGMGAVFNFGKRDAHARDVSLHCCADDLCNMPSTAKITNCGKDIVFMVDRSIGTLVSGDTAKLITFLFNIVKGLDIGPTDNLVGLTEYDIHPHVKWDLATYSDKYDVLRAVQGLATGTFPNHFQVADTDEAVQSIVDHALTSASGDRADHNDAVVIIATSNTAHRISVNVKNAKQLQQLSHDVIVISVGPSSPFTGASSQVDNLATDGNHAFHISSYTGLDDTMTANVLSLLKACT